MAGDESRSGASPFAPVLERNIAALLARQREEARRSTLAERVSAAVSGFAGSMRSVNLHLLLYGGWIVVNLGWTPLRPFDPTLVVLAMVASVEALFLSTFVLITQNRMAAESERRAQLDLHISLIAEHEVTTLLKLVTGIAERVGVPGADAPEVEQLKRDVPPEKVLERLDATEGEAR